MPTDRYTGIVVLVNLLVIGMLVFIFVNLVTIPLVSPDNGVYTTERKPEFVWGGLQKDFVIYVDDDPYFGSPLEGEVSGNSYRFGEDMDFGTYYWQVKFGPITSEVRKLTIGSSVVLAREENEVKNEGNVDVVLHSITGAFVVGVNESFGIGEDEDVKAEQA